MNSDPRFRDITTPYKFFETLMSTGITPIVLDRPRLNVGIREGGLREGEFFSPRK